MKAITPRAEVIAKAATKKKMATFVTSAKSPPTTVKIAYIFDLARTSAGLYLRELESAGEIHRQPRAMEAPRPSRTLPILWMPGKSADFIPKEERLDPIITLRQKVVRTYALNHKRDELVAALFGAAQQ